MIQQQVQYLVVCDSCGKRSGIHHDQDKLIEQVEANGWQSKLAAFTGNRPLLFRCPKCIKFDVRPDGWFEEAKK